MENVQLMRSLSDIAKMHLTGLSISWQKKCSKKFSKKRTVLFFFCILDLEIKNGEKAEQQRTLLQWYHPGFRELNKDESKI